MYNNRMEIINLHRVRGCPSPYLPVHVPTKRIFLSIVRSHTKGGGELSAATTKMATGTSTGTKMTTTSLKAATKGVKIRSRFGDYDNYKSGNYDGRPCTAVVPFVRPRT